MKAFVVSECHEFGIIRELFLEYSKISVIKPLISYVKKGQQNKA